MKLYHGSYTEINVINLKKAKPYKDFGRAFYLTKYYEQAKIWANRLGGEHKKGGIITEFEFNEYAYEDESLKVLKFDEYNEQWFDFIVFNRSKLNSTHEYDIVEGPVADDDVTRQIDTFLVGKITKEEFLEELKFHKPTHQIAFCTLESLQMLEKVKKKQFVNDIDDIITQLMVTEFNLTEAQTIDIYFQSKTYGKLIDENTEFSKKDWQEVYELLKTELKYN
ncbi:MAG: DUF3990 domain-containing protein [Marinilabiliaceae bacterium]|nr:DUF3990 domain-containing protein [Marinilabiliaceae bacterium]